MLKWFTTTNILDGICGILFANINKLFWGRIWSTENKPLQSYQLLAFKQAPTYSSVQEQKKIYVSWKEQTVNHCMFNWQLLKTRKRDKKPKPMVGLQVDKMSRMNLLITNLTGIPFSFPLFRLLFLQSPFQTIFHYLNCWNRLLVHNYLQSSTYCANFLDH